MSDFYLSQIKVKDGYPEMEILKLDSTEGVLRHFITRLFRELPQEEWDAAQDIIECMGMESQRMEKVIPGGRWVINLGGDKVRAPECNKPEDQ